MLPVRFLFRGNSLNTLLHKVELAVAHATYCPVALQMQLNAKRPDVTAPPPMTSQVVERKTRQTAGIRKGQPSDPSG